MALERAAVLVGCLYRSTPHEVHGCMNDVSEMKKLLTRRFHFNEENIQVLGDDGKHTAPSRKNIMTALNQMIDNAGPKDVLFFFFSGCGTSLGNQEAIVPLDAIDRMDVTHLITSDDLRQLVNKLQSEATLTIVADSGYSGGLISGEPPQIQTSGTKNESHNTLEANKISKSISTTSFKSPSTIPSPVMGAIGTQRDGGILLSACQPNETAFEVVPPPDPAYGAVTHAIIVVLDEHPEPITNKELVTYASAVLKTARVGQDPGLYCSDENANAIFLLQS